MNYCSECGGTGWVYGDPCPLCAGPYDPEEELRYLDQPSRPAPRPWLVAALLLTILAAGAQWVWPEDSQERPPEFNWENAMASGGIELAQGESSPPEAPQPQPLTTSRAAAALSMAGINRCVGFSVPPGSIAQWSFGSFPMDLSARPFGASGWGTMDPVVFGRRYTGDTGYRGCCPHGAGAELLDQATIPALTNSYAGACADIALDRAGCNGTPTAEEVWDFAVTTPRCASSYLNCWWRLKTGGSEELAEVIATTADWKAKTWILEPAKVCGPGVYPIRSGVYCGNGKFGTGWPTYYRVEAAAVPASIPWCASQPPPPPGPVPVPPPPPPPACTSWPISGWLEQCGKLATRAGKNLAGAELCSWCEARNPAPETVLARLRALVCEPVCEATTPPPAPPPPPVRTCIEYSATLYVPTESTGRLELVLVRQGESPCPEGTP